MDLFPKDQKGGLAWPDDCYYLAGEEELPFLPSGCSSPDWASLGMGVPEAQREAGTMFSEADVSEEHSPCLPWFPPLCSGACEGLSCSTGP